MTSCVRTLSGQVVCEQVKLCEDMCQDKLCENIIRTSCGASKWCDNKLCVDKLCVITSCVVASCAWASGVRTSCVWTSCVWGSCVWTSCVGKVCEDKWCDDKLCVWVRCDWRRTTGGGRREADDGRRTAAGYRIKNKNPTQRCGEQKREKVTCNPSVPTRAQIEPDSAAKRRRPKPSRMWANFSPQRNLRLPEKTQCSVQILTFKSHPWCSSSNAICREWLAKDNQNRTPVLENKYPSRSFGAAIPLRSAQTELHNTIELQHTTVEHIALMHQFQCTKDRKSHLQPLSYIACADRADWAAKRRRPNLARMWANFSPQRNLRLPEKAQCFVQILTFKSHPWCSNSNAICQQWLAKHNQTRKTLKNKYLARSFGLYSSRLRSTQPLYPYSTLPG